MTDSLVRSDEPSATVDTRLPEAGTYPGDRLGWLIDGPDPVELEEPVGLLEALLPWPLRLLTVAGVAAAAWWWRDTGIGQQLAWGLQAGALALFAIIPSFWWQLLLVDLAIAAAWFLPFSASQDARWSALHVITFVNRQIGHVWALLVWLVIALAMLPRLPWQLGGAAAVVLLGPPLLNGTARRVGALGPDSGRKASGDLLWRRRYLIYLATALGFLVLVLAAPRQLGRLAPLLAAVGTGVLLRTIRHGWRNRTVRRHGAMDGAADASLEARERFRQTQSSVARGADPLGMLLVPLALAGLVLFSWLQRKQLDDKLEAARAEPRGDAAALARAAHAPLRAEVALFLLADAQTHELGGAPFPGQTEVAEVFVSSARRPVALDMLSSVPVRQFGTTYAALNQQRTRLGLSPMFWAHLGDLADLACREELRHASQVLAPMAAAGPLAGVALGNHEMSFQGSFHWSPHWDRACASGTLGKDAAAQLVDAAFSSSLQAGHGQFVRLASSIWSPRGGSLSAVTTIGNVRHRGAPRTLVGIFLDTSDGRAFDWGMPGSVGAVSGAQLDAVSAALAPLEQAAAASNADPVYVVFGHIPYAELAGSSRERLGAWLTGLDARQDELSAEPRVIAYISAHRHAASTERHCVGNRFLREITIGSTTDPPQQAAIVELGEDDEGRLALAVKTLQSVARPGMTREPAVGTEAAVCRRVAYDLSLQPACRPLLGTGNDAETPRDCQELEHSSTLRGRLASLTLFTGPRDPEVRRRFQQLDAEHLLACVCRDGACQTSRDPLAADTHWGSIEEAWEKADRRAELTCLAWAASACQAHKTSGMSLAEALRCAFDDPTLAAEQTIVARLDNATCD